MKKNAIVLVIILAVVIGGAYYYSIDQKTDREDKMMKDKDSVMMDQDKDLGLSFDHTVVPNNYILEEAPLSVNDDKNLEKAYLLLRKADKEELDRSPDGREGPPSMTIYVFNGDDVDLTTWLQEKSGFTNYSGQETQDVTVGEQKALQYQWEGLYKGRSIAVPYDGKIYFFVANYSELSDGRLGDFDTLLNTVSFSKK